MADYPMGRPGQAGHYGYPEHDDSSPPIGARFTALANFSGAAVSLALIVGVGIWGYKLIMRDVTGIPVVSAAEGPMRVAPKNPGGSKAEYQGLAVNSVAGTGVAEPPADRLVLAPVGVGLTDEDQPVAAATLAPGPEGRASGERPNAPATAQTDAEAGEPVVTSDVQKASLLAMADRIAAENEPLSPLSPLDPLAGAAPATPAPDSAVPAPVPDALAAAVAEAVETEVAAEEVLPREGLWKSLRPSRRPVALRTASLAPVAVPKAAGPREMTSAELPAGTRLAQLGAFDSPETARAEWDRLGQKFDVYMEGKDRVIEKASSGGRTFYRLRAHGFSDLADARRFCSALVAERADCIPVVTK